jgi:hypothetical protein
MPPADTPSSATNGSRAALYSRELSAWLTARGKETVTLVLHCTPRKVLNEPATAPDADGVKWWEYLGRWLRENDPERGQVIGPVVFDRIEIECRADLSEKLAGFLEPLPFTKRVTHWFADEPAAPGHRQDPEKLYPYRSGAHDLRVSKLVDATAQLADPLGHSAFGALARAVEKLAKAERPDGNPHPALAAWVRASLDLIRDARTEPKEPTADNDEDPLLRPTATELAKRLLDKAVADLGASGYMMCVRDPETREDFRVVLAEGIRYREMLSGFSGFGSARWVFPENEEDELYCVEKSAATKKLPKNRWFDGKGKKQWISYLRMLEEDNKQMYGYYFIREGSKEDGCLKGLICLHGRYDGERCFSVYLNFTEKVAFGNRVRMYVRNLKADLTKLYDQFSAEFCHPVDARLVNKLLQTTHVLATLPTAPPYLYDAASFEASLETCFTKFLETALGVLGVTPTGGFATLSGFNSDQYLLYPVACAGTVTTSDLSAPHMQHWVALQCDGVVSWVAIHHRPILIPDVKAPHIKGFAKEIDKDVKSEMALPMFAEDELLGVLNFESFKPGAFTKSHLVLMSLVANSIALEWRECRRRRLAEDLARMYSVVSARDPATEWYNAVKRTFRADELRLWRVTKSASGNPVFSPVPTLLSKDKPAPRPNGWTNCIAETRRIMCITDINPDRSTDNSHDYKILLWDGTATDPTDDQSENKTPKKRGWVVPTGADDLPTDAKGAPLIPLNPGLDKSTLCLIGVPLVENITNRCFGVLWLRYANKNPETMFDSLLIRDAFLVPFADPAKSTKGAEPVTRAGSPRPAPARRDAPFFPVIDPNLMSGLVGGLHDSSLSVRNFFD